MPRHQRALHGDAKELARELGAQIPPNPSVVSRINRQFDIIARKILAEAMSDEEAAARGLQINELGKLVLIAAESAPSQSTPVQESAKRTPADVATLLSQTRKETKPKVDARVQVFPVGYGKPVHPTVAGKAWSRVTSPADRVGLLLRAPSIQQAEISRIAHNGSADRVTGGESIAAKHAGSLLAAVTSKVPDQIQTTWEPLTVGDNATFTLQHLPIDADSGMSVTVLVRKQVLGAAQETRGILGRFGQEDARYASPGRVIKLVGETTFAVSPDYVTELTGGVEVQADQPVAVDDGLAAELDEYIGECMVDVLAPAFTSVTAEQELLAA